MYNKTPGVHADFYNNLFIYFKIVILTMHIAHAALQEYVNSTFKWYIFILSLIPESLKGTRIKSQAILIWVTPR